MFQLSIYRMGLIAKGRVLVRKLIRYNLRNTNIQREETQQHPQFTNDYYLQYNNAPSITLLSVI